METSTELSKIIKEATQEPDPTLSNRKITEAHYLLSEALQKIIGPEVGANFHSWAVWGSKKAGVTIRQEDLDDALKNATIVAGLVGLLIGLLSAGIALWVIIKVSVIYYILYFFAYARRNIWGCDRGIGWACNSKAF